MLPSRMWGRIYRRPAHIVTEVYKNSMSNSPTRWPAIEQLIITPSTSITQSCETAIHSKFEMKFDPSSQSLPKRSELPKIDGAPDGAAWFWGKDDEVTDRPW